MPNGTTYRDYRPYESEIDPQYQQVLQTYLKGEVTDPVRQALEQERQRGMADIQQLYGGRGAPTGAGRSAQERFLQEMTMRTGLAGQQNIQQGLQYGMPYMQFGAEQYWKPQEMGMQQQQFQQNLQQRQQQLDINRQLMEYETKEDPWYMQMLGGAGGLLGDVITPGLTKWVGSNIGGGGVTGGMPKDVYTPNWGG